MSATVRMNLVIGVFLATAISAASQDQPSVSYGDLAYALHALGSLSDEDRADIEVVCGALRTKEGRWRRQVGDWPPPGAEDPRPFRTGSCNNDIMRFDYRFVMSLLEQAHSSTTEDYALLNGAEVILMPSSWRRFIEFQLGPEAMATTVEPAATPSEDEADPIGPPTYLNESPRPTLRLGSERGMADPDSGENETSPPTVEAIETEPDLSQEPTVMSDGEGEEQHDLPAPSANSVHNTIVADVARETLLTHVSSGEDVYIIESIDCVSSGGAALLLEAETQDTSGSSTNVRIARRFRLTWNSSEEGITRDNWWCVPRSRYCYSEIGFDEWQSAYEQGGFYEFDVSHLISAHLGIVAAIGTRIELQCGD